MRSRKESTFILGNQIDVNFSPSLPRHLADAYFAVVLIIQISQSKLFSFSPFHFVTI